ncbi:MAG: DUF4384 domain-containing protein [Gemmatimonadota bacterium]
MRALALITLITTALAAPGLRAQTSGEDGGLQARVWLDRGSEPVLRRGETVRIYYQTTENAYAAIFRIDTDGQISLIYPQDPTMEERLQGGVDYRLIFPSAPIWRVDEDPGVGYFFMVASRERLDFSAFAFDPQYGWDLDAVGRVVYEDPYVAIDDYVAQLIPNWEDAPYALDFITYNVGDTYTYPRFLCYDCHDARPYAAWNPYAVPCTTYRVVIYDDPYFYPYYRYSGRAVVVAPRVVAQPRYAVAVRAPGDSYRPIVRTRPPPPRSTTAEFKESPAEAGPSGTVPRRLSSEPLQPARRPTLQRRPTPSSRLPVRTPPSTRSGSPSSSSGDRPDATIVRPGRSSRPSASPSPSRPSDRVSPTPTRGSSSGTRPSAGSGSSTRGRPTSQPSTRRVPSGRSQPSTRPSSGSRPSARPPASARPSPTRPSPTRSGGSTRAAPSRPSPRPSTSSAPSSRPSPSRPPSRPSSRPSTGGRSSSPPSQPSRPTVKPRNPSTTRR